MGYDLVIAISPHDAGPDTTDATFYRLAAWQIGNNKAGIFHEIERDNALTYFSGIADGMGWSDIPEQIFNSLKDAQTYTQQAHKEFLEKFLQQYRIE